jgi:hypothetical protein
MNRFSACAGLILCASSFAALAQVERPGSRKLPDLVVTEFVATGPLEVHGGNAEIPARVTVRNAGPVAAGPFTVCTDPYPFQRVPASPGPVSVSSLPPGVSIEIRGKVAIPLAGTRPGAVVRLIAHADCCAPGQPSHCSVAESREDNNASAPLSVTLPTRAPDLKVRKVWFAKFVDNVAAATPVAAAQPLKAGEKVLLVCDVANDGNADVTGLWTLGFYVDGAMVWNNSWGPLAAGKTLRGVGPWTPGAPGAHVLRCGLDVGNAVRESDETDNQAEIPFQVVP